MRQLDKLLLRSFVGPFIVTFGIALFVLLMQILWLYLDDIAGKGLSFFLIMELLAYKCVGLVPLALPLALLISSVMVLGNLAEHYELSSFKSAGVSLLRVMRPLIVIGVICAGVSYACSDYVIPAANLQFGSRMYDIQQKKPTLNMEPGVFNEDFSQFTIRLGGRDANGRDIEDVLIYDQSKANVGELSEIMAQHGEMYAIDNGRYFVMRLYDGHQYVEQRPGGRTGRSTPFMRTSFASYTKLFDLSEFQLERHASSLFSTNRSMLSTWQLRQGVDSIGQLIASRKQDVSNNVVAHLPEVPRDTLQYLPPLVESKGMRAAEAMGQIDPATGRIREALDSLAPEGELGDTMSVLPVDDAELAARTLKQKLKAQDHVLVTGARDWPGIEGMLALVSEVEQQRVWNRARTAVRSVSGQAQSVLRMLPGVEESRVKHVYDMHMKYSMAVVCIIFIFIGAPMGAIVRKGGFGYPILVSIIFFVIFIILTIFCRKLAESFVVNGTFAGWLPCLILFPISLWITLRAMNDAKLVSTERIGAVYRRARDSRQVATLRRAIQRRRRRQGRPA